MLHVGHKVMIHQAQYEVLAVKPYMIWKVHPETEERVRVRLCDNILLIGSNGRGKHWVADCVIVACSRCQQLIVDVYHSHLCGGCS